jgi:RimJ/RimL family protein N-acetyltransferase
LVVHVDDDRAYRFAEWLGFENEGIMRKYGVDGGDYYRMARVA